MNKAGITTIETYNQSAQALANYFAGNGSRIPTIEHALKLAGNPTSARVVEAGCGDGRDAQDIIPRVASYQGFDPSTGLIALARKRLPRASFTVADALTYAYPPDLDVIYAFASFLHLDRHDFAAACAKAAQALRPGGILLLSLKERGHYEAELVEDQFGKRQFYYYNEAIIRQLIGPQLEIAHLKHQTLARKTAKWLVIALRKVG
jgi:SAM-dependent methyltransferase